MAQRAILLAAMLFSAVLACAQFPGSPVPNRRGVPDQPDLPSLTGDSAKFSGSVTGSVTTLDNRPVPDARVDIRTLDGTRSVGTVYSNPRGAFEVNDVPYGEYEVVVTAGVRETQQRIELRGMQVGLVMRLPKDDASDAGGRTSVSVAQMQVPDKARKAYKKAEDAFSHNKLDEARSQALKALEVYPDYAEALTLKGILDLQDRNPEEARGALEKAVQSDGSYGMAYIALGAAYNALRRSDDAVRVLNRAVIYSRDAWQAYFERARALEAKRDWTASLADLDKAAKLIDKDFPVLHLVRANDLIGLKSYPEAESELQIFLQKENTGSNADEARRVLEQVKSVATTAQK